jgi:cytochrome c biogenesis protein CcdA
MTLFILAYAAGVLTIASPCIIPILPIVLVEAGKPFRRSGLPLLIGLALTFATVASLAAVVGGWAVEANRAGRAIAVGSAGVGLAASVAPAMAQGNRSMAKEELQNPADKYPKPRPFLPTADRRDGWATSALRRQHTPPIRRVPARTTIPY